MAAILKDKNLLLKILLRGFMFYVFLFDNDEGSRTRALKYTKISPMSPPNTDSNELPNKIGVNSRNRNEINPRIIYSA